MAWDPNWPLILAFLPFFCQGKARLIDSPIPIGPHDRFLVGHIPGEVLLGKDPSKGQMQSLGRRWAVKDSEHLHGKQDRESKHRYIWAAYEQNGRILSGQQPEQTRARRSYVVTIFHGQGLQEKRKAMLEGCDTLHTTEKW